MNNAAPLRRALAFAAATALALGLTAMALRGWGGAQGSLRDLLARVQLLPLLGAMGLMSTGMFFVALRWRALIPGGGHLPAVGLTGIICAGLLLNYALPGPVGELAAAAFVARRYGVSGPLALAGSLHGRFVGLSSAAVLALLSYGFGELPIPEQYRTLVAGAALVICLGAFTLGIFSAQPQWLRFCSARTFGALGGERTRAQRVFARLDELAQELADGLSQVGHLGARAYGAALLWAMCAHLCVALGLSAGALALGLHPPFAGIVFTYCAATAGVVVMFAVPGAQLGWDAMFAAMLTATCGMALADAVLLVAMVRTQQLMLLGLGAVALASLGGLPESAPLSGRTSADPAPHHP